MSLQIERVELSTLIADPANPRTHDERNLRTICASLREHGQVEPLIVQRSTRMIIAGNGRREAMRRLGWMSADAALLDVTDQQARKLSITLNRSAELAGWDDAVLARHLRDLSLVLSESTGDWSESLGFDGDELSTLIDQLDATPAPDPDPAEEPGPAASGANLPDAKAQRVELYLSAEQIAGFKSNTAKLAAHYGTDNTTDTVCRAINHAAERAASDG